MNEENTTIMPPEKQIVQMIETHGREELESAAMMATRSRKELFAHLRDPAIDS